jgi:hypothetical protein
MNSVARSRLQSHLRSRQHSKSSSSPCCLYEALLVGRDGWVKLQRDKLVAASKLTAVIETRQMRREEMQQG